MFISKRLIHRLSYSLSLSLLIVLVAFFSWLTDFLFDWISWDMSFSTLLVVVALLLCIVLVITLPLDYFSHRKDRKICESEGISFKELANMGATEKQAIYEKYASL